MFRRNLILLVLLIAGQQLLAQDVSFKASVSKNRLGLNERLRITYSLDKQGGDDFTPSNFRNFKVLAGPMQSTNFSYINGKQSFEQSYTYTIQPLKKGTFTIPSASIKFDGNVIKTNTVKITVTDAVVIPKDPDDPRYIASQNIHLIAEISNTNPYVGESISVIYKIFVDVNKVSVRNTREVESPSFNGFWNQNIEVSRWEPHNGTFEGKPHLFAIIKKTVLIPQKSGKLTIEPMEIEISAGVPIGRRDLFGNMITNNYSYTATTGKRIINVKPLPIENKPIDFNGAVGDFNFKVSSSKTELKANESAQIKVEVTGKGNLKLISLPPIDTPIGLEKFEPEHKENIVTSLSGLRGNIFDQYTVVPQSRGKFKIPSVTFSYFSLNDKAYKTLTSNNIIIDAPQGAKLSFSTSGNDSTLFKRNVVSSAKDIRYISNSATLETIKDEDNFLGSDLFYSLLLLPLLTIPFGIFIGMKKKQRDGDIDGNKRRLADKLARKYLSTAKKQLGNQEEFYLALEKALHNYLKAKLHIETSDISKEKIREYLLLKKVETNIIDDFIKVFDNCDYARYTPTTNVEMKKEFNMAREVITKIDKQL
jgi:uncharacterized cupredoxin-like copper-binding protein